MIDFVLDQEVYSPPYITWLSKNQLLWGGNHWKRAPEELTDLAEGVLKHAGIRKPTQGDLDFQKQRFGYCLDWPEPRTWGLVGDLMKRQFIDKKARGQFSEIEFLYGRGYVDEQGQLDPDYTNGIIGWFIMANAPEVRGQQVQWLKEQSVKVRGQWTRCCNTFESTVQQQVESGNRKAIINSYLLAQTTYKEIAAETEEALPEIAS